MDTLYTHIVRYVQEVVGGAKVRAELQQTEAQTEKTCRAILGLGQGTKGAGDAAPVAAAKMNDFEKAIRRAAIVAPVWMLLRGAMMSFMQGLSAGFKYMEDFSTSILKAQSVITGFSGSTAEAVGVLKQRILELSRTTGESMTNIAKSFYLFGTIGIDFEKSWEGVVASTRFAMATQGDASQIAKTLAMTYKLLGNTIDKTVSPMQGLDFELAKLYKLWQVNAGEAEDYTEALKAFLPTANTMGLSLDQTIALLTTLQSAALLGSRGGTLLRSSFSKLAENLPELASAMNLAIMPGEKMYDILLRVIDVIGKYQDVGDIAGAQTIFTKIFGGVRGSEPIRGLVALRDVLKENIKIAMIPYKEGAEIQQNYNGRIKDVTESLSTQLKLWRELRTQVFQTFITGIADGEDFEKTLTEKINPAMEALSIVTGKIGQQLNYIAEHPFKAMLVPGGLIFGAGREEAKKSAEQYTEEIQKAFAGKLGLKETIEIKGDLVYSLNLTNPANKKSIDQLEKIIQQKMKLSIASESGKEIVGETHDEIEKELELNNALLNNITLQKGELKELLTIERMRNAGYQNEDIALAKFSSEIGKLVNKHNQLIDANGNIISQLTQQQVLALALQGDYVGISKLFVGMAGANDKILALQKQGNAAEVEKFAAISKYKKEVKDLSIEQTLDIAKIKGATSAQLILAEIALKAANGNQKQIDILKQQLEVEKLITKEKLNQVEVGDETMTLYKVAQERGKGVAVELGKFLTGQIDYGRLKQMSSVFDAFKQFFSTRYEQLQAAEYFGIPFRGQGTLGGERQYREGYQVPIPEFQAIGRIPAEIAKIAQQTTISGLNITVNAEIKDEDTKTKKAQKIIINIAEAIRTDPNVQKAIEEQIDNF